MSTPDFEAVHHGTIVMLAPRTPAAHEWCADYLPSDALWLGGAVAIEPRYFPDIYEGITDAGLKIN